jgi:hypothetical protein
VAFSGVTTFSIRFSYIAFFLATAAELPSSSAHGARCGFTASAPLSRSGVVTAVVAFRRFGLFLGLCQVLHLALFTVLRSFAQPGFHRASIATMTSADFCPALAGQISLGQCWFSSFMPPGSTGCVLMTVGLHCYSPIRPRTRPRCPFAFNCGRTFAVGPFAPDPHGSQPGLRLRLSPSPPSGSFQPDRPSTCQTHESRL